MEIVLATRSVDKIKEIKKLLEDLKLTIYSLNEFPHIPPIIEDGRTYKDNAIKKAKIVAEATGRISLSDDSGIEVDALDGRPGIYSSTFAGENATDAQNNQKLLELMKDVPFDRRTARYRCVIAIATPQLEIYTTEATCEGMIAYEEKGSFGFGYDPLFYLPNYGLTMAEIQLEWKNRISHRGKAVTLAKEILRKLIAKK